MKPFLAFLAILSFSVAVADAQPKQRGEVVLGPSGLSLPRFVSISDDKANLRSGPGEQYPIMWVYERRLYPLEIVEEYESWRKVRDIDGEEGWMHVALLSGKRTGLVTGETRTIYDDPDVTSAPVALVDPGVIAEIIECAGEWCRIDAGAEEGWIRTEGLWGIYVGEAVD